MNHSRPETSTITGVVAKLFKSCSKIHIIIFCIRVIYVNLHCLDCQIEDKKKESNVATNDSLISLIVPFSFHNED